MGEVPELKQLPEVWKAHLGNGEFVSYTSRYLTKPGDNYGSLMLAINVTVKRPNGNVENLPLVAKIPPSSPVFWNLFQPERSCLTENAIYKYLSAEIRKLQLEQGVKSEELFDSLSEYYGSRTSLDPKSETVDSDAVLILKNVQVSGFKPGNRFKMYDESHTKLLLRELAKFHALSIAVRIKKPEVYDKFIRPYFKRFNINKNLTPEELAVYNVEAWKEIANATNNDEKALKRAKEIAELLDGHFRSPDTPDFQYATIAHGDLWINNIMFKYDLAGAPEKIKFVDFQLTQYDSVANDIVFLLFSSVDMNLLEAKYDDLLQFYYNIFIETLKKSAVDTSDYSYKGFIREIERIAPLEIWHALYMTKIILADNSTMPAEFKDMDFSIISKNTGVAIVTERTGEIIKLAKKLNYF